MESFVSQDSEEESQWKSPQTKMPILFLYLHTFNSNSFTKQISGKFHKTITVVRFCTRNPAKLKIAEQRLALLLCG
jgi:hypothetical protein